MLSLIGRFLFPHNINPENLVQFKSQYLNFDVLPNVSNLGNFHYKLFMNVSL